MPKPIARRDLLILAVVLIVAALTRLDDLGNVPFLFDESILSRQAQDMVAGKAFPVLGLPLSVGFPSPAGSAWLMAISYALASSPVVAAGFVALVNIAGVGLLWLIARRYFSPIVALVAGLAYAVSPWALMFSRRIWPPDLHTPFLVLALYLACLGFLEGKRWAQAACLPVFIFAFQVYVWGVSVLLAFVVLVWVGRKKVAWRWLALSVVITAVTLIPFGIGVSQNGLFTTLNFLQSRSERAITLGSEPLAITVKLATGTGLERHIAGLENGAILLTKAPAPFALWIVVLGGATLLGLVAVWWRYRRLALTLTLGVSLAMLLLTPTWTIIQDHYFVHSLPFLMLLMGIGAETVIDWLPGMPTLRLVGLAAICAVLLTQAVWWRGMLTAVDGYSPTPGYGTPLHYMMDVRAELAPYKQVVVVSNDYWRQFIKEPFVWDSLLYSSADCIRAIGGNGFAVIPKDPFAVLITPLALPNPVNNLYQTAAPKTFPLRPKEGQYTVAVFDQPPVWNGSPLTAIPVVQFDTGLQLTGYHLEAGLMLLDWRVDQRNGADFQYFGHFLNGQGERVGQSDSNFLPGRYWCVGDRVITWTDIVLPEGVKTLRVGMYYLGQGADYGTVYPRNVLDDAGNAVRQWVDIPLSSKD